MSKSEVKSKIIDFLVKENRPYSLNDILEKCGKEHGKSLVQKVLDSLAENEKIASKTFGKQKIYHAKQSCEIAELKRELQVYNQKLAQSQQSLKNKQDELRGLDAKLRTLSNIPSIDNLEEERQKVSKEICTLNEKIKRCEANEQLAKFTAADIKKIEKSYENVATAYRKRKRICTDMIDAIMEGYPKSKKALIEDIGLETDEAVGFNIAVKR